VSPPSSTVPPSYNPVLRGTSVEHTKLGDRMQFLDALRGLAAMCVVVQHSLEQLSPLWARFFLERFRLGEFGVVVFFLCSGFIIPASLERQGSQAKFWIGRFFRLFPLYWTVLAAVLILHYAFNRYPLAPEYLDHPVRSTLVNLTMLQDFLSAPLALGQSWSLAYELVFYGLVSAMFVMGVHRRSFVWSAGAFLLTMVVGTRHLPTEALNFYSGRTTVALAVALVIAIPFVWYRTRDAGAQRWLGLALTVASIVLVVNRPETLSTSMFFFGTLFFGTSLFRWSAGDLSSRRLAVLAGLGVAAIVVMWTAGDVYWGLPFGVTTKNYRSAEIVTYLAAFAVFFAALKWRQIRYPRFILYLGAISYSLYLTHAIPIYAMTDVFGGNRVLTGILWIGSAILISACTYRLVEKPAIAAGRKLMARLPRPVAA
jgi:peptidoglycan/LPS O-acetylase OafA/YrhL